ncbi:unnamed protein product [Brachionus calyciflorus]|uniref:N-acetyltransferase domain-containing protein n=1 Tax=Brachionus calyciflorus TaxID=104777 RepID=A0A813M3N0_9BILA|nr:unnamed protein product [Brachionus calyciflorus]
MKINRNTRLIGDKVILVPYRSHHVLKYHSWMKIPEIQELTASEPLTLEEEYEMQKKWQNDPDKLTFIVLRKDLYESCQSNDKIEKEIASMIGDVNCFVSIDFDNEDLYLGELEIMIVDKENRKSGFGTESIILMINYCHKNLLNPKVNEFIVKITQENEPSIKMFKKIGFIFSKNITAFQQIELKLNVDSIQENSIFANKMYSIDDSY